MQLLQRVQLFRWGLGYRISPGVLVRNIVPRGRGRIIPERLVRRKDGFGLAANVAFGATSAGRLPPFVEIQLPVTDEDRVPERGEVAGAVHDEVVDERDVEETAAGTCSHFLEAR